jgi:hypothetical protein
LDINITGTLAQTSVYLSFIDPEREGFGVIFPEVMIFSEGQNIITEGNIAESPERRVYK